jgi:hypothetical protein
MGESYGVIYCLTAPDGKTYIGQARNFKQRMGYYKSPNWDFNKGILAAIRQYGWASFTQEVIDEAVDYAQLNLLECLYISKFQANNPDKGYNQQKGGYVVYQNSAGVYKRPGGPAKPYPVPVKLPPSIPQERYVLVDIGYGPAVSMRRVRVIEERKYTPLVGDEMTSHLLVEYPGGSRLWVDVWQDIRR